jgi:hypothetical protein
VADAGFYGVAQVGATVGQGATGSRYASLDGIVKTADVSAPYTVANEYICGTLALAIGLPVPPGTIARLDDGSLCYVMLRFGPRGEKPPPGNPADLVRDRARLAARIAVFDCWVMNPDRHPENFAYVPGEAVGVFDHGHALLGTQAGNAVTHLTASGDGPSWAGAIVPELQSKDDLYKAAELIRGCADNLVAEACEAPQRLGIITVSEAKKVSEVLRSRKKRLTDYIDQQRAVFTKISDWGLAP